ncbi:SCO family protein [Flavipsychrobacter stenotrophus]|uniref:SCO family protein n=1 Tax=Flavipsychrobacter stenotrophus TaxID=2077091 RepID=A0A2S7SWJ8_9BACT|nr:SCO family protein [Flavipsychrobacter stenotrophus]PQJ11312.1 SCO family protein [Flavipsychrobacter stenotrophus]
MAKILIAFFMILGIAFLGYYYKVNHDVHNERKLSALPIIEGDRNHHVGAFSFTNQDGKVITNADVKGKVVVVSYFFATCKGICPRMNENMTQIYKAYRGNKDVIILSHTVDPKKDTVAALKAYSLRFDADPNQWMFLTGSKKELYDMARYSYLINAKEDTVGVNIENDFIHDEHYSLVDRHGRIRGFYNGLEQSDIKKLTEDIKSLLQETD